MSEVQDRKYQTGALENVSAEWSRGNNHVLLVAPTGAGKGTMCGLMAERVVKRGKRMLVMAHRRRLIQQLSERMQQLGIPYTVEMADLPDAPWVQLEKSAPVIIASRDTLMSRMERNGLPTADLFVPDEAHNWERGESRRLAEKLNCKYWLGMTATPCRGDGSGLGKDNWDVIVEAATERELVEQKYLVPVRCYAPPELGQKRKRGEKTPVAGDPVSHWMRYAEGKRTVGFCESVAESLAIRDRFRDAGVTAEVISAKTPDEEREDIIGRIKEGKVLWCGNVAVMTEGVDVPEWEVCQLLCKCKSFNKYKQAVGRIRRVCTWTGKEYGILLDHSGAVFEHGFPDEPIEWRLEDTDDINERIRKAQEEGQRSNPVLCAGCGCLFAGLPTCPECGAIPPRREKKEQPETAREKLVEVMATLDPYQRGMKQQREWMTILRICAAKGWSGKRANAMFKNKFGTYPERTDVEPVWNYEDSGKSVAELCPKLVRKAGVS